MNTNKNENPTNAQAAAMVAHPECSECKPGRKGDYVRHDQCIYFGRRVIGHSPTHCTADACY